MSCHIDDRRSELTQKPVLTRTRWNSRHLCTPNVKIPFTTWRYGVEYRSGRFLRLLRWRNSKRGSAAFRDTRPLLRVPFRNNSATTVQHATYISRLGKKKPATCCVIIIPAPLRITPLNNLRGVIDNIVSGGSPKINSTCCVRPLFPLLSRLYAPRDTKAIFQNELRAPCQKAQHPIPPYLCVNASANPRKPHLSAGIEGRSVASKKPATLDIYHADQRLVYRVFSLLLRSATRYREYAIREYIASNIATLIIAKRK